MTLPTEALPLLGALVPAYTRPTAARFVTLLTAAILTSGRRAVANLLRTLGPLAQGHCTAYQRVLSRAPWSGLELSCALAGFLLRHVLPGGPSSWSATTRWSKGPKRMTKDQRGHAASVASRVAPTRRLCCDSTGSLGHDPLRTGRRCGKTPGSEYNDRRQADK